MKNGRYLTRIKPRPRLPEEGSSPRRKEPHTSTLVEGVCGPRFRPRGEVYPTAPPVLETLVRTLRRKITEGKKTCDYKINQRLEQVRRNRLQNIFLDYTL